MRDRNKYLTFAILIGGKSNRLGTDKGLYEYKGKPFVSYQIEAILNLAKDIFLVANSQEQVQSYIDKIDYSKLMGFIIDDNKISSEKNLRTPMLGLYSLFKELSNLGYEKGFVLSCDNPFIKPEVLKFLIKISHGYDLCIPRWDNGFVEPLFTIYPIKKAYKTAKYSLEKKKYKLTNIISQKWKIRYVSIEQEISSYDPELISFKNLNKPSDMEELDTKLIKEKN